MKIYQVGGAVRDRLLKRPVKDRDWVVVGSTPDEMSSLGYKAVGKDFPVFTRKHMKNMPLPALNARLVKAIKVLYSIPRRILPWRRTLRGGI